MLWHFQMETLTVISRVIKLIQTQILIVVAKTFLSFGCGKGHYTPIFHTTCAGFFAVTFILD